MSPGKHAYEGTKLGRPEHDISARDDDAECVDGFEQEPALGGSVDDILQTLGFGRFQVIMIAICGMSWFVDSVEVGGMSYIYITLDKEWHTTTANWGLLGSVKAAASVSGSLVCGMAADRFGRRPAFLAALGCTAVAGLASAAATNFSALLLLRSVTNAGAGGLLPIGMSLLNEHLPPSHRESCMVCMQIFFVSGHVLAVVLSMLIMQDDGNSNWRFFVLALATPPTLLLAMTGGFLPESPVFLQQSGQHAKAVEALARIQRWNGMSKFSADKLCEVRADAGPIGDRGFARILSSRALLLRTFAFGCLWGSAAAASDWTGWVTEVGHSHGFSEQTVGDFMIVLKLSGVIAFLVAACCARRGRGCQVLRGALVACSAAAAVSVITAGRPIALASAVAALAFAYDMVWALLYATTASAFDPLCRASALSATTSFSKAASGVTPLVSGVLLLDKESSAFIFWAVAWVVASCLGFALDFRCPSLEATPSKQLPELMENESRASQS
eukprot:TRINITY_DN110443_c0_g1_i1.p1 TRINITY_DN110443_c0_g1~~TRINITY_DN110443_c0_g1_i1.p1  ORF type:complete len:501 (+),score=90.40 TRINITY_DN110443_c0_g1_i1:127-1629(+)